ncbi:MAG TPA: hypothetical protein VM261_37615 [Kofleriaceae bacterium]|nr:hypothetical protein [Kofleriaceae bacterium]
MRLATPFLALVMLSGCHLYFGDGRDDGGGGDDDIVDAPWWVTDGSIDAPWIDGGPPMDGGMAVPRPTAVMRANSIVNGAWVDQGLADWSCMGTPTSDQASTGAIQLSGRVLDYPTTNGVGGAAILAYAPSTSAQVGSGMTATNGASRGSFTMTLGMLPSTSRRYTFAITGQNFPGTYLLEQYIAPGATATRDLQAVSAPTLNSLAQYVGLVRNPANAIALGDITDCQGRAVSNAVVIASRTRSQTDIIGGARTFYFSGNSSNVPVTNQQSPFSNLDGKFMILDVPPITAGYAVQVLGFRTQAELDAQTLRLVAQVWSPANGGTVSIAPYQPRRQGQ